MDTFDVRQGTALPLEISIADAGGAVTAYSGTEALSALVWPGADRASAFSISPRWVKPSEGEIALTVTSAQTLALSEGRWFGSVTLVDPASGPIEAYAWAMDVLPTAGLAAAPPSYCGFRDLLHYGRSWLRNLQTPDDDNGFGWACGKARADLDDMIIKRARVGRSTFPGDPGYGSLGFNGGGGIPSPWLRAVLDGGGLILRDWVIESTAKAALGLILEGQIGEGDQGKQWRALSNRLRNESNNIALGNTAEIYTGPPPAPGVVPLPNYFVTLGSGSLGGR